MSTVGMIAVDYGYVMYVDKGTSRFNEVDALMAKLSALQSKNEALTKKAMLSKNDDREAGVTRDSLKHWKLKIAECRKEMDAVSDELARMSEKGRYSSLSEVHKRSADRLCRLCRENRGIYIKLGQHISQLDHLVPDEYIASLRPLLADAPRSEWEAVCRVVEEDLGQKPEDMFVIFEKQPLASASLAQVHIAYDEAGKKYAVKVQHEGLREGSRGDLVAITFLVEQLSQMFDGFSYLWLAREMNANLPLELNFEVEAANCNKCREQLADMISTGDVALPEIHKSAPRVLVMGFEDGSFVNTEGALQGMGLKESDVARTISRTFCEQIYRHGFVHCDPHEANLLVRRHPFKEGAPQIVLLDHGLYRELHDDFRRNYCRLWRGLVTSDEKEIKANCEKMNAGAIYTLLAAMLTMKPWDDIVSDDMGRLKSKGTRGESEMLKSYAKKYFKDIVGLLGTVPPEMLLLLKTNDCLRHLDTALGVPVNTATIVAQVTSDVILWEDLMSNSDYQIKLKAIRDYVNVCIRVMALKTIDLWLRARNVFSYWLSYLTVG